MPERGPTSWRGLSIRTRLTVWYSLSVLLALAVFAGAVYIAMWRSLEGELDKKLREGATFHTERLAHQFAEETFDHAVESVVRKNPFRSLSLEIYDARGQLLVASADLGGSALVPPANIEVLARSDGSLIRSSSSAAALGPAGAETASTRVVNVRDGQPYVIVTYAKREDISAWLNDLLRLMVTLVPVLLLLSTGAGHMLAARSLAPVVAMAERARSMGAEDLSARLVTPNPGDELGELAQTFNEFLDRIETAFKRMRQFVADASHELRTPVAVIRGEADVALSPPTSQNEALDSLSVIRDEAIRMGRLVDDMFFLARADARQASRAGDERICVRDLVERAARAAEPLSASRRAAIRVDDLPSDDVTCLGDRLRLEQLLRNLLDNATKYGGEGSAVSVSARVREHGGRDMACIEIADNGPGIPSEFRDAVFDRFFCVDRARTRRTGGSGLGLPIARSIAESHGGTLTLAPNSPTGCVFSISLPVVPSGASSQATPIRAEVVRVS